MLLKQRMPSSTGLVEMILTGRLDRIVRFDSDSLISFIIPNYQADVKLDDVDYKIELSPIKSKRSLAQNKMMWKLISDVAKHEGMDSDEIYIQVIKLANIRTEILQVLPEAIERLSRVFKLVVERERRPSPKGIETAVVECYYGTSQFDTKEMSDFIDRLLDYAARVGIDVSQYGDAWQ